MKKNIIFIYVDEVNSNYSIISLFIRLYSLQKYKLFSDYFLISEIMSEKTEVSRKDLIQNIENLKPVIVNFLNTEIQMEYALNMGS